MIRKKINPFLLRRTKQEVGNDLPERVDQTLLIRMCERQKEGYGQLIQEIREGINSRMDVLTGILKLRQYCCHPKLVGKDLPSAKFESLFFDLEELIDQKKKILVFSQFRSMLGLMTEEAENRGWSWKKMDGTTKNRMEVVDAFQESDLSLLFISLKVGGVGLNLTRADYVFLYDPWWNGAIEEQAIARAHRMGREGTVFSKRLINQDSLEEKILSLKARKASLGKGLLEGPESLNQEELRSLIV